MLAAISAGWAFAVSVSSASGPSNMSRRQILRQRRVDALEHFARGRKGFGEGLAHADRLRPLTRKHQGRLHGNPLTDGRAKTQVPRRCQVNVMSHPCCAPSRAPAALARGAKDDRERARRAGRAIRPARSMTEIDMAAAPRQILRTLHDVLLRAGDRGAEETRRAPVRRLPARAAAARSTRPAAGLPRLRMRMADASAICPRRCGPTGSARSSWRTHDADEYRAVCAPERPLAWRSRACSPISSRVAKTGRTVVAKAGLSSWRIFASGEWGPTV